MTPIKDWLDGTDDLAIEVQPTQVSEQRPKFTPASTPSKEKEHVSFRTYSSWLRFIDEAIALRVDPSIKTRSDFINESIHNLIWEKKNLPQVINLRESRRLVGEVLARQAAQDESTLDYYEDLFQTLKNQTRVDEVRQAKSALELTIPLMKGEIKLKYQGLIDRMKEFLRREVSE